jgi:hypothetical protein
MLLVVAGAVGVAALRNASQYWATAIAIVVFAAVATSVVGALVLRGANRYGCVGFAVFSVAYLSVAIGNSLADAFKDPLGTTALLTYVSETAIYKGTDLPTYSSPEQRASLVRQLEELEASAPYDGRDSDRGKLKDGITYFDAATDGHQGRLSSGNRWRSWLPGAVNANEFLRVGHSLFALLSGLVGTWVGRFLYALRKRSETQAP